MGTAWPAAVESRDAFDAVVAACWLAELLGVEPGGPREVAEVPAVPAHRIEGAIWPAPTAGSRTDGSGAAEKVTVLDGRP